MKKIRVLELFAGVGGFRLGLEKASNRNVKYEVVWSNQWEPGSPTQHASEIYIHRFGAEGHSCEDIEKVIDNKFKEIKDHDLLVGGFPCQDYSVARTLSQSEGLNGKKGILWWSIHDILKKKKQKGKAPKFLMLENVDRLLKSPATQRGRDLAVMLASLSDLGYAVEWRVINAADYGFPQRRRRVFIIGYKKRTDIFKTIKGLKDKREWIERKGVIADAFPVERTEGVVDHFTLEGDLPKISETFSANNGKRSPFENAGVMIDRNVYTKKVIPKFKKDTVTLGDIIIKNDKDIPEDFFIDETTHEKWRQLKGAKKEKRTSKSGFTYDYSEGGMVFPDDLNRPSRTIVTGEGGTGPSRFKHVIRTKNGRLRRLTPVELERLNMFPDEHTKLMADGREVSPSRRAFIMGNALVVGVIDKLGRSLAKIAKEY